MAHISSAIDFFYLEYKVYPGKPGPITSDVYDELKGSSDAKINIQHTDYIKEADVETVEDSWGHPCYFRIDAPDPKNPEFPNVAIISCGPNGIFENGKGDDISSPMIMPH